MNKAVLLTLLLMVTLPLCAQSDAYLHYSQNPNLDVAFFEKLRIDDTTTVDVTVIIAKDSATWAWMIEEFKLSKEHNLAMSKQWQQNPNAISTRMVQKNDPSQRATKLIPGEFDFETISFFYRRINIYHIINNQQRESIFAHIVHKISKKKEQ